MLAGRPRSTWPTCELVFDGPSQAVVRAPKGPATIARRLVSDLFTGGARGERADAVGRSRGRRTSASLKLVERDRPYFVGRDPRPATCRFTVEELSREHASFTRGAGTASCVRDLGSKNGILVNGVVVTVQRLSDGDVIQMGPLKLRLMDPEDRYLRELGVRRAARHRRTGLP